MGTLIDETGHRYGRLTVIERAPPPGQRRAACWLCMCECGEETVVDGCALRSGHTQSCGCLQRETISQLRSLAPGLAMSKEIYARYRWRAGESGKKFALTIEEFRALAIQNCHYCGVEPGNIYERDTYNGAFTYNGLDRIESSKGYVISNLVPCCWTCNRAKGDMSYSEFIDYLNRLVAFRNR